jgi:hypothetical protein
MSKNIIMVIENHFETSYQYLLGKDWLNVAEVNGYISDAGTVTLGDKAYLNDTSWPTSYCGEHVTGVHGNLVFTPKF